MDVLIYSGQELFILDGDALLQFVLDDPLLAFGRSGDPSLQLLHATYLLEKTVDDLLKKDTMFEIVFFESQAHASIHTGAPAYVSAARRLARSILIRRANLPDTKVHRFESLDDDEWKTWYQRKRVRPLSPPSSRRASSVALSITDLTPPSRCPQPMYVLGHDGGLQTKEGELQAERILIQRQALYDTVHQSLPYVLLQAAELTDTKVRPRRHSVFSSVTCVSY